MSRSRKSAPSSEQSTRTTGRAHCVYPVALHLPTISMCKPCFRFHAKISSFGVVKAFLEADLLPRVITGTSAGGLVAALLCTRTDAELKRLLVPRLADKITACDESIRVWFKRFRETGARFSTLEWARKVGLSIAGDLS